MRYRGLLYRALNPVWARQPLSGHGAARHGGRFNPKGRETLYTALSPETAIREANQAGTLQPTTLVAFRADIEPVLDAHGETAPGALADHGATPELLADPGWRARMNRGEPVPTQDLALRLIEAGFAGLLVRSFARGAGAGDLDLVLWRWSRPGARLELVDDESRLTGG